MGHEKRGTACAAPAVRPPVASVVRPAVILWLALGCSAETHARKADAAVSRELARAQSDVLGDREHTVRRPEKLPEPPPGASEGARAPQILSLRDALELAVRGNRDYQSRAEDLYLTVLGLVGARYAFSARLSSILSYVFADGRNVPQTHTPGATFGVQRVLPWGGEVSLDASSSLSRSSDPALPDPDSYSTSVSVQLTQPLLRGSGYEVSHGALIQAERNVIYAVRDFELFREDFSIDVARRFYGLVARKQALDNQAQNLQQSSFDRRKAEALFNVGRVSELNVLRSRRQELTSQNDLLQAQEDYALELDRFRIFLGLPENEAFDVAGDAPELAEVSYDPRDAVSVALENRLDVLNRREQLEDAERALRIARNGLLPDLDLGLSGSLSSTPDDAFLDQEFDQSSVSAGLSLTLPLDRVLERNAYRSAEIANTRARRSNEEFEDVVVAEIRSAIRELDRRRESVEIQLELIRDQEKNKRIAQLQFERGDVDNREVVDAEQALLEARNALVSEQVSYEIARLELLRDLGILFIDERGMWKE